MAIWKNMLVEVPTDEQTVWVRVLNIYGELTLATWCNELQTFTTVPTGLVIPAYYIARWRFQ